MVIQPIDKYNCCVKCVVYNMYVFDDMADFYFYSTYWLPFLCMERKK
jgi:hypothetical protein